MPKVQPNPSRAKPKKKSPAKRRARRSGKKSAPATGKKNAGTRPATDAPVGRLERTRRLLLAALRVWELKRRVRE